MVGVIRQILTTPAIVMLQNCIGSPFSLNSANYVKSGILMHRQTNNAIAPTKNRSVFFYTIVFRNGRVPKTLFLNMNKNSTLICALLLWVVANLGERKIPLNSTVLGFSSEKQKAKKHLLNKPGCSPAMV